MKKNRRNPERYKEILDIAEELFLSEGYDKTAVEYIIRSADIAKGTFYHYFKSKEELLDAVIKRIMNSNAETIRETANNPKMTAMQKLRAITTFDYEINNPTLLLKVQKEGNAPLLQKILVESVLCITPIMAKIVRQGVREGTFKTKAPHEAAELVMIMSQFLFERNMLQWTKKEMIHKIKAHIYLIEKLFGVKEGSLGFMATNPKRVLKKHRLQ